jgi:hypothetical protein
MIEHGVQGFIDNDSVETSTGLPHLYEFFVKYVRRIHTDNHWKRTMKTKTNIVFFQLITPSDIAYIISVIKNGRPVWITKKKKLFEASVEPEKKPKPHFTLGKGQKRTFGKSSWSIEGKKYYHKVETTWKEAYANKAQMTALVNGWERWVPDDEELKKGKELLNTHWYVVENNAEGKGKRKGSFDDNDDGLNDDNGYHSDVYTELVEYMPFKLDNGNLRKVTGLGRERVPGDDLSFADMDDINSGGEQKEDDKVDEVIQKKQKTKRAKKL